MKSVSVGPVSLLLTSLLFASLNGLTACGGGSSGMAAGNSAPNGSGSTGANLASTSVYVTSDFNHPPNVLQFSRNANGLATPTVVVQGPAPSNFMGLAIDAAGNLYVGEDTGSTQILVYPPGSNEGMKPKTTIFTALAAPTSDVPIYSLEVDGAGNVYAGSAWISVPASHQVYSGVAVFSPAGNGSFTPSKVIAGPATTIQMAVQLAIDSANNLYVANDDPAGNSAILIFNSAASGNVPPVSTISGPNTTIFSVAGVALDPERNVYVLSQAAFDSPTWSILEFGAGSVGNVTPIRTISGSSANMVVPTGLRVDNSGNIYVLDFDEGILKFASNATGNAAPLSTITVSPSESLTSIALQQ